MSEQNISPFGCYIGKFLDGFTILDGHNLDTDAEEADAWEVSVMVKAQTPEEAYEKIVEIANRDTKQYRGELDGVSVEWSFKGIVELDPVFSGPCLCSDFIYLEHHEVRFAELAPFVRNKEQLCRGD